jgi:hypothetical protein
MLTSRGGEEERRRVEGHWEDLNNSVLNLQSLDIYYIPLF